MAEPAPGRFITLEGGEGAGKSTLMAAIAARLRDAGIDTVTTREPGGTPLAEAIRAVVLKPPGEAALTALGEALLMNAARADHLARLIRPALTRGTWVISDRFSDSTRVYQGAVGGADPADLLALEQITLQGTVPDLTLILDVPVDIAEARRAARRSPADAFEARSARFHDAIRQGFISLAHAEPARCVLIDASQSPAAVADAAWTALCERLLPAWRHA